MVDDMLHGGEVYEQSEQDPILKREDDIDLENVKNDKENDLVPILKNLDDIYHI